MNWHEFVFSNKTPYRYIRHLVFWMAWGLYFFASMNFLPRQGNVLTKSDPTVWHFSGFTRLLLILLIHILACYAFIYFALPRYLLKAKYVLLAGATLLLALLMVFTTRFVDTVVYSFLAGRSNSATIPYYESVFNGLVSAIKIIAVAAAIRLVKQSWLKQKEKERLEKEKIEADLQLLKAQIHPSFLFSALNNIYSFSLQASSRAPDMLLKLSDILSYMLYDCSDKEVLLEKEIKMLRDYMALEKIRYGDKLEMNIQVKGDTRHDKIAPLLLMRFIENSFAHCNNRLTEQPWINLEIQIAEHLLLIKLMNGKSPDISSTEDEDCSNMLQAKRRLELLYPGRHVLRIMEEPEIMMVTLEIDLRPESTIAEVTVHEQILFAN